MEDLLKNVIILAASLSNLALGLIVFSRNPKSITNQLCSLIALLFFAWGVSLFLYEHPLIFSSLFWIRITFLMVTSFISSALIFSFAFPKVVFNRFWAFALFFTAVYIGISIYLLFFTNLWVSNVVTVPYLKTIIGRAYLWWVIMTWLMVFGLVANFFVKGRVMTGRERAQMKFFWLSFLLYSISVNVPDVILPLVWRNTDYFYLSAICSVFFSGTISYTILKHRFLDIKFALQQFLVYGILSLLTTAVFVGIAFFFWYVSHTSPRPTVIPLIVGASVILSLLFGRMQNFSETIARKFFFQSIYDYQKTLRQLSISLSSYLEMPVLVDIIINALQKTMRLNRVAVLVRDFTDNHYKIQKTIGFNEDNGIALVKDNFLTDYLEKEPQIIVLEEVENLIDNARQPYEKERLEQLRDHMEHIEAALIVPVVNTNRVISLIVLGDKISSDPYTVQDVNLLHTISSQASIAIENARLYREVASLNQGLQQKVNIATLELQKKNTDLKTAYNSLRELDKLKDDFISIASHELRTPMTAIKSYLWMAINRSDIKLSERVTRYLSRAFISTDRLINLVNDLLNVSRIEAGRIEIRPGVFEVTRLAEDVMTEVGPKAAEKQIRLSALSTQMPQVFADQEKVREVLLNLVSNALKFTPGGGTVTISFFSDGGAVEVAVKDSGMGISKEDLPRLFQKFGRLDNSYVAAATAGGTGLGLYISRSLVELMKGKIWASSEGLGKGATFTFSLPVATPVVLAQAENYTRKAVGEVKFLEPVAV